ncbi:MAG: NAD(+) diphosphatase [Sphingomonadales bacterium]|nr:NAD(+) diphosphatase [Sphingomonadales bacterium]
MAINSSSKRFAPMFSNSGLARLDHWREDSGKMAEVLNSPDLKFIGFVNGKPLMDVSAGLDIHYFSKAELPDSAIGNDGVWNNNWVFLGTNSADTPVIALEMSDLSEELVEGWREKQIKPVDLRSCAMQFVVDNKGQERAAVLGTGKSLLDWHRRHGFCAQCGRETTLARSGHMRVCVSDNCKAEHYPRTDPVVIMLVLHGDECLLGRSPNFAEGSFSALAGFLEQGETIEEAVKREVMEEVALEVDGVEYMLSQPWPFPSSLMIGCSAVAKDKNFKIDGNEIASAKWFTKAEVKAGLSGAKGLNFTLPPKLAIAHDLLQNWLLQGKN